MFYFLWLISPVHFWNDDCNGGNCVMELSAILMIWLVTLWLKHRQSLPTFQLWRSCPYSRSSCSPQSFEDHRKLVTANQPVQVIGSSAIIEYEIIYFVLLFMYNVYIHIIIKYMYVVFCTKDVYVYSCMVHNYIIVIYMWNSETGRRKYCQEVWHQNGNCNRMAMWLCGWTLTQACWRGIDLAQHFFGAPEYEHLLHNW